MTTLTIDFDTKAINYISKKEINISSYLNKLVIEDMLLNDINESKKSGKYTLNSLDDLDN